MGARFGVNALADQLSMSDTHYTDPSGLDLGTVSIARGQVVLASKAMALPVLARSSSKNRPPYPWPLIRGRRAKPEQVGRLLSFRKQSGGR